MSLRGFYTESLNNERVLTVRSAVSEPLKQAIKNYDIQAVKKCINDRANPNGVFSDGNLPLMDCIKYNKLEIAKYLLQIGASATKPKRNHKRNVFTPLHYAISQGNLPMVELLLDNGADLTIYANFGHAIKTNNVEIVRELIKRGADVNGPSGSYTEFPIMWAIQKNNPDTLKLLLENGATTSSVRLHADKLLLECAEIWNINYDILDFLLENGASVDCVDHNGEPLLIKSVRLMNLPMIQYLIKHKADLNVRSSTYWTPLSVALSIEDFRTFKLLIESGADPKLASEAIDKMAKTNPDFAAYMTKWEEKKHIEDSQLKDFSGHEDA